MRKSIFFLILILPLLGESQQTDTLKKAEQSKAIFFANLYSSFNYSKSDNGISSGFAMPTALFGYSKKIAGKVSGTIILDVTRTTNNIIVLDSNNYALNVSYFEGSKYTAFLKVAEIKWDISSKFSFSAGQLLNTQYLTLQDKFWEHRYVEVTFQELNRLGMPADFGMRFTYTPNKKVKINIGAFNGEGPFRYQDSKSNFLFSGNIEYQPTTNFIIKTYYSDFFSGDKSLPNQGTLSLFLGYKNERLTFGLEYDRMNNQNFTTEKVKGFSGFAYYNFNKKIQVFYRYDYLSLNSILNYSYQIGGIQISPVENFTISANYRHKTLMNENMFFINLGLKI